MRCSTRSPVQYSTSTLPYRTVPYRTVQYSTLYSTIQCNAVQYSTIQYSTARSGTPANRSHRAKKASLKFGTPLCRRFCRTHISRNKKPGTGPPITHRTSAIFYVAKGRLRLILPTNGNHSVGRKYPTIPGEHENIYQQIPAHTRKYRNLPGCQQTFTQFLRERLHCSIPHFSKSRGRRPQAESLITAARLTRDKTRCEQRSHREKALDTKCFLLYEYHNHAIHPRSRRYSASMSTGCLINYHETKTPSK